MIDELDNRIIEQLIKDGRQSSESLAKMLESSPTTIKRRINHLIESGVIRITALVDPSKVGFSVAALVAIDVVHDKLQTIMDTLINLPQVRWLTATTGRFDIIMLLRFSSNDELADFLQKRLTSLDGIKDTETFVVLHQEKLQYVQMGELLKSNQQVE
jgi:Lrp/AsnC family transcriptional regulator for asnA, asnC and gidA